MQKFLGHAGNPLDNPLELLAVHSRGLPAAPIIRFSSKNGL